MIHKQPIFASVVVVVVAATAVTTLATTGIDAFQPAAVRQVVLVHNDGRRIDTTGNKRSTVISSSLDSMKCHPSLVMLHQAADAWTGGGSSSSSDASASRLASGGGFGSLEQIEYKIYPDGRVEELVRGIKGNNCQTVTQAIHEQLGKVVATEPTEEMYEQEVQVSQTLYNTDTTTSNGDWSSSSW